MATKFGMVMRWPGTPTPVQILLYKRFSLPAPSLARSAGRIQSDVSASYFFFLGGGVLRPSSLDLAETPAPIFTISTSNDVVLRKDAPFGGPENKILHFDPISTKRKFLTYFWRDL